MERFTSGINSVYTNHYFVAGERGMKCRNCNRVMTIEEWEEKRRCFCGSTDAVLAIAASDRETIQFPTPNPIGSSDRGTIQVPTPTNPTTFREFVSPPVRNSNRSFVNQDLSDWVGDILSIIQFHKKDLIYIAIILFLGINLFNSCSQPKPKTRYASVSSSQKNQPRVVRHPYNWRFPRSSCGDRNYSGLQKFYPVYVNRTDINTLNYIKRNYCRDAFITVRKQSGKKSIQVVSFSDRRKAFTFAQILLNDSGVKSAEVGEPTLR